jgi:alpha-amylase
LFGHPVSERSLAFATGLRMLRDLIVRGVGGFRFDGADRIPPEFFAWALPQLPGLPALAEVVSDDVRVLAPYLTMARLRLYDFALLSTMREAFAPGGDLRILRDPLRHGRALPSPGAVTFVRNHDVERGQANDRGIDEPAYRARFGVGWDERTRVLDRTSVRLAHAYIFGRADGTPYVLAGMERSADDLRTDRHDDPSIVAGLTFRALCQPSASRPEVWLIAEPESIAWQRGDDRLALVNKAPTRFAMDGLRTSLRPGRYRELVTGWPLQIGADGVIASWQAPARWAGLFTFEDAPAPPACHPKRQTAA